MMFLPLSTFVQGPGAYDGRYQVTEDLAAEPAVRIHIGFVWLCAGGERIWLCKGRGTPNPQC